MDRAAMIDRTEAFTVRIAKMEDALPRTTAGRIFGSQVLRWASSIGANYRESGHASSRRQFTTTLDIAQREAGETIDWLRVIARAELLKPKRFEHLIRECDGLLSILTAAIRTAKRTR